MESYNRLITKYFGAGLFGAFVPVYFLSLALSRFDFQESLKTYGILTGARAGLSLLGGLPPTNKIPIIKSSYKLFAPEFYGFLGGLSAAAITGMLIDNIKAERNNYLERKKGLEDILNNSEENPEGTHINT